MADFPLLSSHVYASRETIRSNIIDYLKSDLNLQGIDLTKTSFVSFLINLLSVLTANLHFYSSSVYREFFLTQAQMPESIYSLSSYLGYSPSAATPASGDVLIVMPLNFEQDNTITLDRGFKFTAGNINCSTYYKTHIYITNTSSGTPSISVKLDDERNSRSYNIPVFLDQTSSNVAYFILPVKQYDEEVQEFSIDSDLGNYQFSTIDVLFEGKLSNIKVYVQEPGSSQELYTNYNSLFLMEPITKGYVFRRTENGVRIYFGNGLMGHQPPGGSKILVHIEKTLGAAGNIVSYGITNGEKIYVQSPSGAKLLDYTSSNPNPISGGEDEETLEEIRKNSIDYLTARMRMVSENDFRVASQIFDDLTIKYSLPVLKRSDVKVNEIQMYTVLRYGETSTVDIHKDVVPTRNIYYTFPNTNGRIKRGTILNWEGRDYRLLFDIDINANTNYNPFIIEDYIHKVTSSEASQTNPLITLGLNYTLGANNLEVYLNGVLLRKNEIVDGVSYGDYDEYSSNKIRFNSGKLSTNDILYIRRTSKTEDDFLYPIDTTNELFISNIDCDFIFNQNTELRVFKNGILQYEKTGCIDPHLCFYNVDWLHSSINFNSSDISFGDLIRFRSVNSIMAKEFFVTVSSSEATNKFIILPVASGNYIEIYKNGRLLTPMGFSTSVSAVIGDYFRTGNGVAFNTGVISVGDVLKVRYFPIQSEFENRVNGVADYYYNPTSLKIVPSLSSRSSDYPDFKINYLQISSDSTSNEIEFKLYYQNFDDATNSSCLMQILEVNEDYVMENHFDATNSYFSYTFNNINSFPVGTLSYEFLITNSSGDLVAKYNIALVMNKKLDMFSNIIIDSTGITIYDIPVVEKTYYDSLNLEDFEAYLQTFLQVMEWPVYKMLTDSINLKFANTHGLSYAMEANEANRESVKGFVIEVSSLSPTVGDRYIIQESSSSQLGIWYEHRNKIIEWNGSDWDLRTALSDDIILNEEDNHKYIYNGEEWVRMVFDIPLHVELEVFKNVSYLGSDTELATNIKNALLAKFNSRFGINVKLYTSEIISTVQAVYGVHHCNLIQPKCNIFFDEIDLTKLTQDELLKYSPDFVYFTSDTIEIKILAGVS